MNLTKRVKHQERTVAVDLGGRRQPGSGSAWYAKGDVKTPKYLVECKQTEKKSYSLQLETIRKIEGEAAMAGREALLQVTFIEPGRQSQYMVVPYHLFLQLTGEGDE